jgi:hypothetical protein
LRHRPSERNPLPRALFQGGTIGGDGLAEPLRPALPVAKPQECIAEIVLRRRPVERKPLLCPLYRPDYEARRARTATARSAGRRGFYAADLRFRADRQGRLRTACSVVDPDAELAALAQAFAVALSSVPRVRATDRGGG